MIPKRKAKITGCSFLKYLEKCHNFQQKGWKGVMSKIWEVQGIFRLGLKYDDQIFVLWPKKCMNVKKENIYHFLDFMHSLQKKCCWLVNIFIEILSGTKNQNDTGSWSTWFLYCSKPIYKNLTRLTAFSWEQSDKASKILGRKEMYRFLLCKDSQLGPLFIPSISLAGDSTT